MLDIKRILELFRAQARPRHVAGVALGVVACALPAVCQQVQLLLPSVNVPKGGSTSIGLTLADSGGAQPASLEWAMTYSGADITGAKVALGSGPSGAGKTVACNSSSGSMVCTVYGLNVNVLAAGTVATLTFTVSSTTSSTVIPITVSGFATSGDGSAIPVSATGANLSVTSSGASGGTSTALSGLSCNPSTVTGPASTSCTVTLSGAASGNGFPISLSTNNSSVAVPSRVTIPSGKSNTSFTANVGEVTSKETATLTASASGVTKTFSLTLAASGQSSSPVSIWKASTVPATVTVADANAVELGVKFRSDVAGQITGVRFYKGPYNRGTHQGHLWTSSGKLLGTVTFQNESASGWQEANFASPISIQANTTYIISYYAPAGEYSANTNFFTSAVNTPPLHALQSGTDGPNGVYKYGASGFPNQSYHANNYWVDVVFVPAGGSN